MKLPVDDWMLEVAEATATEIPLSPPNSMRMAERFLPGGVSAAMDAVLSDSMYVATT